MLNHRVIEIKVFVFRHAYDRVVLTQHWIELAGFAAEKSPEIIEAERVGPAIKRPGRSLLGIRRKMPFADCSGVVAVELKNLGNRCGARRPVCAVTRPAASQFTNRSEANGM